MWYSVYKVTKPTVLVLTTLAFKRWMKLSSCKSVIYCQAENRESNETVVLVFANYNQRRKMSKLIAKTRWISHAEVFELGSTMLICDCSDYFLLALSLLIPSSCPPLFFGSRSVIPFWTPIGIKLMGDRRLPSPVLLVLGWWNVGVMDCLFHSVQRWSGHCNSNSSADTL